MSTSKPFAAQVQPGSCRRTCAGANRCICTNIPHVHHICKSPDCACHWPETYDAVTERLEQLAHEQQTETEWW